MDIWEETLDEIRRHQWNKDLRLKEATTSDEREDIRQDLRENHWVGGRDVSSQDFQQELKSE
jgi:hypothetical protein